MKEFEFDDIEISDEEDLVKEETVQNKEEDPLYQKFSFDIDIDSKEEPVGEKEPEIKEDFAASAQPIVRGARV